MLYRALADLVLIIHLAFVLFVIAGSFAVLRWPRAAWLHLPAVIWGTYVEFSGRICPLTPMENALRHRGGEAGYSGGFIEHYLTALIYPDGLTRRTQMVLGSIVVVLNVVGYLLVLRRMRRRFEQSV